MEILIEYTNNFPLRMLAWIGIIYAFTGLVNYYAKQFFFIVIQILLLLVAVYINFTIDLDSINTNLEKIKSVEFNKTLERNI